MTAKEVGQLLSIIGNIFPNFNPKNIDTCLEAWTMVLCDEDGERIRHALAMYVKADHEFPPTPGQLITLAKPKPVYMNELEAWSLVRKAICNGIYGAEAEFAKLPPEVQRAVGDPGQLRAWAQGDIDSLQTVAQSNFCRVYRGVIRRIEDNVDRIGMADNLRLGVDQ